MHIHHRLGHLHRALTRHIGRHGCNINEILDELEEVETQLDQILTTLLAREPAHIHITATHEGHPMADFPVTATATLTATVTNAENVDITTVSPVTFTADAGTLTTTGPDTATLTDSGIGTVNITATTANGILGTLAVNFVDNTPAAVAITAA